MMKTILVAGFLTMTAGAALAQDTTTTTTTTTDPAPVTPQTYDPHYDRQGEIDADQAEHDREDASNRRRHRDVFFIVPEGGVEIENFQTGIAAANGKGGALTNTNNRVYVAPVFAVDAGFRLGYLNLGARYQRSWFQDNSSIGNLNTNKLYAIAGVTFGKRVVVGQVFAGFGWAFIDQQNAPLENGIGGELGASIDFYVTPWLSLGLQASVDGQGYKSQTNSNLLGAVGGTGLFRLGFHI